MQLSAPPIQRYAHVVFEPSRSQRVRLRVQRAPVRAETRPAPRRSDAGVAAEEAEFCRWVLGSVGLEGDAYRVGPLGRRLGACLRALKASSLAEARERLEGNAELMRVAASALLIGTTGFFRDAGVFEQLRRTALPELMRGRAGLAVWSAACSDGAELYSVGMLLGEAGRLAGSRLVGTDCRPRAIEAARAGVYGQTAGEDVPEELRGKWLSGEGPAVRVAPALRQAAQWEVGDVMESRWEGCCDLVLCRNLAIYLEPAASEALWRVLAKAMRPGGVLVVGKAERPSGVSAVRVGPCIYRLTGGTR